MTFFKNLSDALVNVIDPAANIVEKPVFTTANVRKKLELPPQDNVGVVTKNHKGGFEKRIDTIDGADWVKVTGTAEFEPWINRFEMYNLCGKGFETYATKDGNNLCEHKLEIIKPYWASRLTAKDTAKEIDRKGFGIDVIYNYWRFLNLMQELAKQGSESEQVLYRTKYYKNQTGHTDRYLQEKRAAEARKNR